MIGRILCVLNILFNILQYYEQVVYQFNLFSYKLNNLYNSVAYNKLDIDVIISEIKSNTF